MSGQSVKLACLGDSITGVYYHTGGRRAWPEILSIYLQQLYPDTAIELINAGISGNTSAQGLARMDTDVLAHSPHLMVVMFGMNDIVHATIAEYEANLRAIIQGTSSHGVDVVLMTPNYVYDEDPARPLARLAEYAETMRRVGRELAVPVADAFATFQDVHNRESHEWMRLMSDPVHPNLRGHQFLAATAAETISGLKVTATDLPNFEQGLPRLSRKIRMGEPLKIVAMTPFNSLVSSALQQLHPGLPVTVIPWDTTRKSITTLQQEVMQIGWSMYRENSALIEPDLFIVTTPDETGTESTVEFYRSFAMILNRTQSFGAPRWDCLVALPAVANPTLGEARRMREQHALHAALDKDLPILQRLAGDQSAPAECFKARLASLISPETT
jgi:acyl-CoA thioesterase I